MFDEFDMLSEAFGIINDSSRLRNVHVFIDYFGGHFARFHVIATVGTRKVDTTMDTVEELYEWACKYSRSKNDLLYRNFDDLKPQFLGGAS